MKICEIRDDYRRLSIGFLYYFEDADSYLIELPETLKKEDAPICFDAFLERKTYTVGPEQSRRYVESRVIPRDRQNIGAILRSAGLKEYDAFRLLMLSEGKCAQDDCSIHPVNEVPEWLERRKKHWIREAVALPDYHMFLTFEEGTTKVADLRGLLEGERTLAILLQREADYRRVRVCGSGRYLDWGAGRIVMYDALYRMGTRLALSREDFARILEEALMDVPEICEKYDVSRQYVHKKLQEAGVQPVKKSGTGNLYRTDEVRRSFEK